MITSLTKRNNRPVMPAHHLPPLIKNQMGPSSQEIHDNAVRVTQLFNDYEINGIKAPKTASKNIYDISAVKVMQLFESEMSGLKPNQSKPKLSYQMGVDGSATGPASYVLSNNNRNNSNHRPDSNSGSQAGKSTSSGSVKKTATSTTVTCISPDSAMKQYMQRLSSFEHHEIFSYPNIYFVGQNAKKKMGIVGAPNNCGYDDDQGSP